MLTYFILVSLGEETIKYLWLLNWKCWLLIHTWLFALFEFILYSINQPEIMYIRIPIMLIHITITFTGYFLWRNLLTKFLISVTLHTIYNYTVVSFQWTIVPAIMIIIWIGLWTIYLLYLYNLPILWKK